MMRPAGEPAKKRTPWWGSNDQRRKQTVNLRHRLEGSDFTIKRTQDLNYPDWGSRSGKGESAVIGSKVQLLRHFSKVVNSAEILDSYILLMRRG